jgi:hypothetical protein
MDSLWPYCVETTVDINTYSVIEATSIHESAAALVSRWCVSDVTYKGIWVICPDTNNNL